MIVERPVEPKEAVGSRTAVTLSNRLGFKLFGVLHTPRAASSDLGVILLSPGVKMRVGPQRLYLPITDLCLRLGLPVLRFDFYGLGDSEGCLSEELLKDVYNHIEVGRFVPDTLDAMDWMQIRCGTKRFILGGLCGGAVTGLLAGGRDDRVAGLLGLGITPLLASKSADPGLYMTMGQLRETRKSYVRKMISPTAWLRLLTLQSDYRIIWKSIVKPLLSKVHAATPVSSAAEPPDNVNPLFPPAFFTMASTARPMLLVFGGSDRLHFEFEEKFVARHRARLNSLSRFWQAHTIENANHVLSFSEWQREMLDATERWLTEFFASDLRVRRVEGPERQQA